MNTNKKGTRTSAFGSERMTIQEDIALSEAALIVIKNVATPEELAYPHLSKDEGSDPPGYKHDAQALMDRITEFPPEALALIDGISDDHLFTYLAENIHPANWGRPDAYPRPRDPEMLRPVMKALFNDIPGVIKIVDALDESEYDSVRSYVSAVGERFSESIGADGQLYAFLSLLHGHNITYQTTREDELTGEVTQYEINIDGHIAQRKAAIIALLWIFVQFPRHLSGSIEFLKEYLKFDEQ